MILGIARMILNEDNNIIITARYTKQQKIGILLSITISILILVSLYFGVKISGVIYSIGGVVYLLYCCLKPSKIIISSNTLSAHIFSGYSINTKMLYINEVSKCKITEDYDVILYDKDGVEDDIIDIASFDKADIQVLSNILSKYFPISFDNSLAAEGFTVPQYKTNERSSSRKRRVFEEKNSKKTPENNISHNGRKLEL